MKKIIVFCMMIILSAFTIFPSCTIMQFEDDPIYYTVTFRQEGEEDIVKRVESGKGLSASDIPEPKPKEGYTVMWENVNFERINQNIIVYATETKNGYNINFLYDVPIDTPDTLLTEITTEQNFVNLPTYMTTSGSKGYYVEKWLTETGEEFSEDSKITGNMTLKAEWNEWTKTADVPRVAYSIARGVYTNTDGTFDTVVLEDDGAATLYTDIQGLNFASSGGDSIKKGYYLLTYENGGFGFYLTLLGGESYKSVLEYDLNTGNYKFKLGLREYAQGNRAQASIETYETISKTYKGKFFVPIDEGTMSDAVYEGSITFFADGTLSYQGWDPFVSGGGHYSTLRTGIALMRETKMGYYTLFTDGTMLLFLPQMVTRVGRNEGASFYNGTLDSITKATYSSENQTVTIDSGVYWEYQEQKVYTAATNSSTTPTVAQATIMTIDAKTLAGGYVGNGKELALKEDGTATYGGENATYTCEPSKTDITTGKLVITSDGIQTYGTYQVDGNLIKIILGAKYVYIKELPTQQELRQTYAGTYTATYGNDCTMELTLNEDGTIKGVGNGDYEEKLQTPAQNYISPDELPQKHMGRTERVGTYSFCMRNGAIEIILSFDITNIVQTWVNVDGMAWEYKQKINATSGYYAELEFMWGSVEDAEKANIPVGGHNTVGWAHTIIWNVYNYAKGTAKGDTLEIFFEAFSDSAITLQKTIEG